MRALVATLCLLSVACGTTGVPSTATSPQPTATSAPPAAAATTPSRCEPTRPDSLGPFYVAGAPERARVDSGYVLSGSVRAAPDCAPIAGALIEFWLANPQGVYDDAHRASIRAASNGEYRFESNVPVSYGGRPPHIHVRVTAQGFAELVTQHYPTAGATFATFDLVLTRAR